MNVFEQAARLIDRPRDKTYKPDQLIYAAYSRCKCGAGLAYVPSMGLQGYWDCSDILTGVAPVKGEEGAVVHSDQYPFVFYEIKSERQPSAQGVTTRPNR